MFFFLSIVSVDSFKNIFWSQVLICSFKRIRRKSIEFLSCRIEGIVFRVFVFFILKRWLALVSIRWHLFFLKEFNKLYFDSLLTLYICYHIHINQKKIFYFLIFFNLTKPIWKFWFLLVKNDENNHNFYIILINVTKRFRNNVQARLGSLLKCIQSTKSCRFSSLRAQKSQNGKSFWQITIKCLERSTHSCIDQKPLHYRIQTSIYLSKFSLVFLYVCSIIM